MPVLTYLEAIRQGISEEMERDPAVFCIGEDIGIYGGAFKITEGFIDRFGPERVIDTPIAESAIVGAAFGASLTGMRPVAEFQWRRPTICGARPHRWFCVDPAAGTFMAVPFIHRTLKCGSCITPG